MNETLVEQGDITPEAATLHGFRKVLYDLPNHYDTLRTEQLPASMWDAPAAHESDTDIPLEGNGMRHVSTIDYGWWGAMTVIDTDETGAVVQHLELRHHEREGAYVTIRDVAAGKKKPGIMSDPEGIDYLRALLGLPPASEGPIHSRSALDSLTKLGLLHHIDR